MVPNIAFFLLKRIVEIPKAVNFIILLKFIETLFVLLIWSIGSGVIAHNHLSLISIHKTRYFYFIATSGTNNYDQYCLKREHLLFWGG
jgi:hypothetical protein